MNYPSFFDEIETIKARDELSNLLGAFDKGEYEFSYLDIVKSAGHSCPTVAGAYLITLEALKALYKDELPKRGEIKVEFKETLRDGVAGVIANVISHITGATDKSGFKGLNGKFSRHSLMDFDSPIESSARFTRIDTNQSIDVYYDPSSIGFDPLIQSMMQKMMQNKATKEEIKLFGELWQDRVKRIFQNKEILVRTSPVE